jgi:hypothetical protein
MSCWMPIFISFLSLSLNAIGRYHAVETILPHQKKNKTWNLIHWHGLRIKCIVVVATCRRAKGPIPISPALLLCFSLLLFHTHVSIVFLDDGPLECMSTIYVGRVILFSLSLSCCCCCCRSIGSACWMKRASDCWWRKRRKPNLNPKRNLINQQVQFLCFTGQPLRWRNPNFLKLPN